jgi:hypothetical protein
LGGLAGASYSIFSQFCRPGGINWGNVAEATVTGTLFGAISGASFGLGTAALYGLAAGSGVGISFNVFIYDYPDAVHYPWEEDNFCPLLSN